MYAGYDHLHGFQLYNSDPSGNFFAWKANATGKGGVNALSTLKTDYDENMSLQDAISLTAKVICKTLDTAEPEASRFEIFTISKDNAG